MTLTFLIDGRKIVCRKRPMFRHHSTRSLVTVIVIVAKTKPRTNSRNETARSIGKANALPQLTVNSMS